jgi:hypothetical protein
MRRLTRILHKILIPSHHNNYRAKALHLDFLVGLLIITTLFSAAANWLEEAEVLGFAKDIRIDRLYALTNEVRVGQGLPALKYNDKLSTAAQNKAQHMLAHDYWAHFGAGKSPWDFILESGYSYEVAGENLAKGFLYSESVVDGWKASPTHYSNIIRPEYDEIGFAVTNGVLQGEEVTLVVQMFGSQLAQQKTPPSKEDTQIAQVRQVSAQELEPEQVLTQTDEAAGKASPTVRPVYKATGIATTKPAVATSSFISIDALNFNWTTFIIGFLLTVLLLDLYFAHKLRLLRLSGKNIAHIIFLGTLIIGLFIIKNGVIL